MRAVQDAACHATGGSGEHAAGSGCKHRGACAEGRAPIGTRGRSARNEADSETICAGERSANASRDLFRDEAGLTTTSMVLALLVSLALIFSSAQVYRVNSLSAEVQDVADAAALSAESQVGEFMIAARFCDAVSLTLSLTGIAATGIGIVALCVPPISPVGKALVEAGQRTLQARDAFAQRACDVLNALQKALPYYAAACAANVAAANNEMSQGSHYVGAAVLVPLEGKTLKVKGAPASATLADDAVARKDEIADAAKRAEEACEQVEEAKLRGFMRDCGDAPAYCMTERAETLAGLSGSANPQYTSVDAWSFSVPLARAQAYYAARLSQEAPVGEGSAEQARSELRRVFYRYASDQVAQGYVHDDGGSFEACFPRLPRNTAEMRDTTLYTDQTFPLSQSEDGEPMLHAWAGCAGCSSVAGAGTLAQAEADGYAICPVCGFDAASLGSVAAASSSIDNGFEYHYDAVAQAAEDYEGARRTADEQKAQATKSTSGLFDLMKEALSECAGKRIKAQPPGHDGAVAFVVNAANQEPQTGFENRFVESKGFLGPRAAVAGATLVDEGSDDDGNVITSMLDGIRADGGAATQAADVVLSLWTGFLTAYADGQKSLEETIEKTLNRIPTRSKSGIGTQASKKLKKAIKDVNLDPANLGSLKPVLVNSGHVASKDKGDFAQRYIQVKGQVAAHPMASTDLFSALLDNFHVQADTDIDSIKDKIDIATIDIFGTGDATVTISIPLPEDTKPRLHGMADDVFAELKRYHYEISGERPWE